MGETLRIRGERLDVNSAYIDVTIDGYSIDNEVTLVEVTPTDAQTWTIDATTLQSWRRTNDVIPHSAIEDPTDDMWDTMERLIDLAARTTTPPKAGEVGRVAAADLFRTAAEADTSENARENARGNAGRQGPPQ
jgi:hypothetical protein